MLYGLATRVILARGKPVSLVLQWKREQLDQGPGEEAMITRVNLRIAPALSAGNFPPLSVS